MAHFAKIDKDTNLVLEVVVLINDEIVDENNEEQEQIGINRCKELFGDDYKWVQTSYNGNIRKRYAGKGYKYDEELDAFLTPPNERFPSWVIDTSTADWMPPIPYPEENVAWNNPNNKYKWNEELINWELVE